jgi:transposase
MLLYCGLDVHKTVVEACILDAQGAVITRLRFDLTPTNVIDFCKRHLGPEAKVVLEATTNVWAVVKLLRPLVGEVVVSNPLATKAIAQSKVKTDKVDAHVLAQLLRCGFLPAVWQPDNATLELRQLVSRRSALVGEQTAIKNRLHSVLAMRLLTAPCPRLFSNDGFEYLRHVELDADGRLLADIDLRLLEALAREMVTLDQQIAKRGHAEAKIKLLMTLPGVSVTVATAVLAALGDVSRFRDGDAAAAYLGLVPTTKQSAHKCYHGSITKTGNSHARWMLVQAAQHMGRHPGPLGHFFNKLKRKKSHNVAVVAVARKLVVIAWHMLTKNEPYRYALSVNTEEKLRKLRVLATGEKRKPGSKKGERRTAKREPGVRTKTEKPLAEVYASEGLPTLGDPPAGEAKVLAATGTTEFVESLKQPKVTVKKLRKPKEASVKV